MTLKEAIREVREKYYSRIIIDLKTTSDTYAEIALRHGVSENLVWNIARMHGLGRTNQKEKK